MQKASWMALVMSGALTVCSWAGSNPAQILSFATSVVNYNPGALSGSELKYANASSALGAPTLMDQYSVPIDQFYAPYETNHILLIGAGGSLTVKFDTPIRNSGANPYGADFLIYGAYGLNITNGDYYGAGISDGTYYNPDGGNVRISVSQDGVLFYTLNPTLTRQIEAGLPTDSFGQFGLAPNPALNPSDLAGLDYTGMRALYAGSAGGAGYDLSLAQDGLGGSVNLLDASYLRVDVLDGRVKVDAFSTAVPEPSTWALGLVGAGLLWWRRKAK